MAMAAAPADEDVSGFPLMADVLYGLHTGKLAFRMGVLRRKSFKHDDRDPPEFRKALNAALESFTPLEIWSGSVEVILRAGGTPSTRVAYPSTLIVEGDEPPTQASFKKYILKTNALLSSTSALDEAGDMSFIVRLSSTFFSNQYELPERYGDENLCFELVMPDGRCFEGDLLNQGNGMYLCIHAVGFSVEQWLALSKAASDQR
jgi:hypothetical protein